MDATTRPDCGLNPDHATSNQDRRENETFTLSATLPTANSAVVVPVKMYLFSRQNLNKTFLKVLFCFFSGSLSFLSFNRCYNRYCLKRHYSCQVLDQPATRVAYLLFLPLLSIRTSFSNDSRAGLLSWYQCTVGTGRSGPRRISKTTGSPRGAAIS